MHGLFAIKQRNREILKNVAETQLIAGISFETRSADSVNPPSRSTERKIERAPPPDFAHRRVAIITHLAD